MKRLSILTLMIALFGFGGSQTLNAQNLWNYLPSGIDSLLYLNTMPCDEFIAQDSFELNVMPLVGDFFELNPSWADTVSQDSSVRACNDFFTYQLAQNFFAARASYCAGIDTLPQPIQDSLWTAATERLSSDTLMQEVFDWFPLESNTLNTCWFLYLDHTMTHIDTLDMCIGIFDQVEDYDQFEEDADQYFLDNPNATMNMVLGDSIMLDSIDNCDSLSYYLAQTEFQSMADTLPITDSLGMTQDSFLILANQFFDGYPSMEFWSNEQLIVAYWFFLYGEIPGTSIPFQQWLIEQGVSEANALQFASDFSECLVEMGIYSPVLATVVGDIPMRLGLVYRTQEGQRALDILADFQWHSGDKSRHHIGIGFTYYTNEMMPDYHEQSSSANQQVEFRSGPSEILNTIGEKLAPELGEKISQFGVPIVANGNWNMPGFATPLWLGYKGRFSLRPNTYNEGFIGTQVGLNVIGSRNAIFRSYGFNFTIHGGSRLYESMQGQGRAMAFSTDENGIADPLFKLRGSDWGSRNWTMGVNFTWKPWVNKRFLEQKKLEYVKSASQF